LELAVSFTFVMTIDAGAERVRGSEAIGGAPWSDLYGYCAGRRLWAGAALCQDAERLEADGRADQATEKMSHSSLRENESFAGDRLVRHLASLELWRTD